MVEALVVMRAKYLKLNAPIKNGLILVLSVLACMQVYAHLQKACLLISPLLLLKIIR
jgi:hypothetical protein